PEREAGKSDRQQPRREPTDVETVSRGSAGTAEGKKRDPAERQQHAEMGGEVAPPDRNLFELFGDRWQERGYAQVSEHQKDGQERDNQASRRGAMASRADDRGKRHPLEPEKKAQPNRAPAQPG